MPDAAVDRFGLYYPYIRVRDESWLKLSALYWPRMARIVSPDYPVKESKTAAILRDRLDYFIDTDPKPAALEVVQPFYEVIQVIQAGNPMHADLADLWSAPLAGARSRSTRFSPTELLGDLERSITSDVGSNRLAALHVSEFSAETLHLLDAAGLMTTEALTRHIGLSITSRHSGYPVHGGTSVNPEDWVVMDARLAWLYKVMLSDAVAKRDHYAPVTDQVDAYTFLGSGADALPALLRPSSLQDHVLNEFTTTYGLMSLGMVVPKNLARVSVDKIVELRTKFGEEFDRWRAGVDLVSRDIGSNLTGNESASYVRALMEDSIRTRQTQPLAALRKGIKGLGLDTLDAVLQTKVALPAVVGPLGDYVVPGPLSLIVTGVGFAYSAVTVVRTHVHGKKKLAESDVSYLLRVKAGLKEPESVRQALASIRRLGR